MNLSNGEGHGDGDSVDGQFRSKRPSQTNSPSRCRRNVKSRSDWSFETTYQETDEITIFDEWMVSVESMFKKSKVLRESRSALTVRSGPDEIFKLPERSRFFAEPMWHIDALITLKDKLNEVKCRLDDKEVSPWHRHTRTMNPGFSIQPHLKSEFLPEYCSMAWGKFMEIISTYPIIPESLLAAHKEDINIGVNSVHLCEAPGAFISAANHFIKTNCPGLEWKWLGTTLNPYHEGNDVGQMINEDKLILTSSENWTFLKDNTGNIINRENIKSLVRKTTKLLGSVHFMTADGSIDCQDSPGEQEGLVVQLHYAEIISALQILEKGGSFVIKIFTFLEYATICHLYLLSCVFKEVKLVKPVSSKEGNSEVYVICLEYVGRSEIDDELEGLFAHVGISSVDRKDGTPRALFPRDSIPDFFIQKIQEAAEFFISMQISVIERNLASYPYHIRSQIYPMLKETQNDLAIEWTDYCKLRILQTKDRLSKVALNCDSLPHVDPRISVPSLIQRQKNALLTFKNLKPLQGKLKYYASTFKTDRFTIKITEEYKISKVILGKGYTNIHGSRFCFGKLLLLRDQLRQLVRDEWESLVVWNADQLFGNFHCTEESIKDKLELLMNKYHGKEKEHPWTLHCICYHETLEELATKTDAEVTQSVLVTFIQSLEELEIGSSIFLCEFSLLTRLHIGIIFSLTSCFEKVTLCYKESTDILGVLLYGFKGFDPESLLEENLVCIVASLEDASPIETILECLEMSMLCNGKHAAHLLNYNVINLTRTLQTNVKIASQFK